MLTRPRLLSFTIKKELSIDVSELNFRFNEVMSPTPAHIPVMKDKIIELLTPVVERSNQPRYFDGTFGRGGHLREILRRFPQVSAVAIDQDLEAVEFGLQEFAEEIKQNRLKIEQANFSEFSTERFGLFDAMLVDLGVSSPQLDEGRRGFSFYHDGPLDMRMNNRTGSTAAELIASASEDELNDIFKNLGEIQKPFRVTRAIVQDRNGEPFLTTRQLASLIERVEGWRRKGFHPATQYFMALRLSVNRELEVVQNSMVPLIHGLTARGRLAVLTFHSLEDRIVKNLFKEQTELGSPLFKKVIQPEWTEQKGNPRSRSAKLRIFERLGDESPETEN